MQFYFTSIVSKIIYLYNSYICRERINIKKDYIINSSKNIFVFINSSIFLFLWIPLFPYFYQFFFFLKFINSFLLISSLHLFYQLPFFSLINILFSFSSSFLLLFLIQKFVSSFAWNSRSEHSIYFLVTIEIRIITYYIFLSIPSLPYFQQFLLLLIFINLPPQEFINSFFLILSILLF